MKKVHVSTRGEWRKWLVENHSKELDGIWLIFNRQKTSRASLAYEDAVNEALCFGWIDSVVRRIDDEKYCRKFTPRKDKSNWSELNKRRATKLIKEGAMTGYGLAKIEAARRLGNWAVDPRPVIPKDPPRDLSVALEENGKARQFFETLAPTYQKQFIGWIVTAKRSDTRAKRIRESLALLAESKKLGMK